MNGVFNTFAQLRFWLGKNVFKLTKSILQSMNYQFFILFFFLNSQ